MYGMPFLCTEIRSSHSQYRNYLYNAVTVICTIVFMKQYTFLLDSELVD